MRPALLLLTALGIALLNGVPAMSCECHPGFGRTTCYGCGGSTRERDNFQDNSTPRPPQGPACGFLGLSRCPAETLCTADDRCLSLSSERACSDGKTYCPTGFACAGQNDCIPSGSDYCGNGKYCTQGFFCGNNQCVPRGSVECSTGGFCPPQSICAKNNECLSVDSPRMCSNGSYCDAGFLCTTAGSCLALNSERVCPNGKGYCPEGEQCTKTGSCIPRGSVACSSGGFCPHGSVCADESGECLASDSPRVCPNGKPCREGSRCTDDNFCIPIETVDCGHGNYCAAGNVCTANGCRPEGSVDCGDGNHCDQGFMCIGNGRCLLLTSARACSDRKNFCAPGFICAENNECLSVASRRVCLDQKSHCDQRSVCGADNKCLSPTTAERDSREVAWTKLLNTRPDRDWLNLQRRLRNRKDADFNVQRVENGTGAHVNIDTYEVEVTRMPTNGPASQQLLLQYIRTNLNIFFDHSRASFGATRQFPEDAQDWRAEGPAPLGAIMLFDVPFALHTDVEMGVITSASSNTMWVFTPITLGFLRPGEHPVAGNREFGIRTASDGTIRIYTRGADRVYAKFPGEDTVLEGGDALWRSFQAHVVDYIKGAGGGAFALPAVYQRPLWTQVQSSGRFSNNTPP
jgi:hypothetical protein